MRSGHIDAYFMNSFMNTLLQEMNTLHSFRGYLLTGFTTSYFFNKRGLYTRKVFKVFISLRKLFIKVFIKCSYKCSQNCSLGVSDLK